MDILCNKCNEIKKRKDLKPETKCYKHNDFLCNYEGKREKKKAKATKHCIICMNEHNIRQEFLHYAFKGTKNQLSGGVSMYDFEDQVVFIVKSNIVITCWAKHVDGEVVDVHYANRKDMGKIVGKGGEMIKKIKSETDTEMGIICNSDYIEIAGEKQNVQRAKSLIDNILYDNGTEAAKLFNQELYKLLKESRNCNKLPIKQLE